MSGQSADETGEALPQGGPGGSAAEHVGGLLGAVFLVGSLALIAAMTTDFVSVVCRHLHVPFVGAIEIIEACIIVAVAASGIAVTLIGGHASVHLVVERLSPPWRTGLARVSDALGFIAFSGIAVGDLWLLWDTWTWNERSDLLGLPILPLRLVWAASLVVMALLFLRSMFKRRLAKPGLAKPDLRP